jgi:hypothetical protein
VRRWDRENSGGGKLINIYCKHKLKCDNVSPLHNYYMQLKDEITKNVFDGIREITPR